MIATNWSTDEMIVAARKEERDATIERCAQVAEQHVCTECSSQIAAAIRKLKG